MFERNEPDDYKCKGCEYFSKQYVDMDVNIDGIVNKTVIWFPSCRYYLNNTPNFSTGKKYYSTLFLTTERCKKFELSKVK
jgi:hypothetical protein